jgi:hypothetical protein
MPASRSVVAVPLRELGDFSLHPQGRPCGRPPAAAVLGRQRLDGHRGTGLPFHPSNLVCRAGRGGGQRVAGTVLVWARSRIAR